MSDKSTSSIVGASTNSKTDEKNNVIVEINSSLEEQIPVYEKKYDVALKYAELAKDITLTDEENKKIRRKIDLIVLPLICLSYSLQFMDRSTLSYTSIMGLREDLKLVGDQYSWASSCFFFGYLGFALIGSWSLQKIPLGKGVSGYLILWGFVLAMHATCKHYASIVACRVFLGMFESPLLSGLSLIINNFYHKSEQYPRLAFIFAATGIGNIVGSTVAYGVQMNKESFGMAAWRFLFLILGISTVVFGVVMMIFVPDIPTKAWWLTPKEKIQTVERIRENEQGFGTKDIKWYQVKEAFLEPRVYIYALLSFSVEIPNSGITAYAAILLKESFGYSTEKALLMKAPMGVTQCVGLSAVAILNMRGWIKHPLIVSIIGICCAQFGGLMFTFATQKYTKLAGFYLIGFSPVAMITALSGLSTNIAGRTKKVVCNGIYLTGFATASIIGPQTFVPSEAPHYETAKRCCVGFYASGLFLICTLLIYNRWDNKKRDQEREALGDKYVKVENSEFADLTDRENRDFRYVW